MTNAPTNATDLTALDAYWRACNYLAAGMIYLRDNPLLREPLKPEHIKERLLGHWGSSPGLSFIYVHVNRVIAQHDLNAIFIAGPGHGAPGVLAPVYLEGAFSEAYPDKGEDAEGMRELFRDFSFPGGLGSHCTPELPGSIHEGGELGYSLSHAFGAVFDSPDLIAVAVVGDGEAETGPLATAWHSNKFLNPKRDGAVLPVLHLNGYKINNPTVLARIPEQELEQLLRGYGWDPIMVSGDEPMDMHRQMAAALDRCVTSIREMQKLVRSTAGQPNRPTWPMIVLRSPKGWTGPKLVDGLKVEGSWRAHQVPLKDVRSQPAQLEALEAWLRSYRPEELFDEQGRLVASLKHLAPRGHRRMGANPHANGGLLRRDLRMPGVEGYAVAVTRPAQTRVSNTRPLGQMLRDVMRGNPGNFRLFGPDETTSNKLDAVYEESGKFWIDGLTPEDSLGGHLSADGRVMEMLSEHTLEGWLEGYLLTGRHGLLATYEAFVHVIDSMFNQHAKWLTICNQVPWRAPVASLNLLITSTVWRQDHNGFTHQDPGFLDLVVNKSPEVTRIYLPPDANSLLFTAEHCLRSHDNINVIVCDKQDHLQFLGMDDAIRHCTKGIGSWDWASNDQGHEPDLVMAGCGDIATQEALAATALLREFFPNLRIRFINVVDLFRLTPRQEHPHGLPDSEFDSLFTKDKPIIFNFHGYPWLIHRLAYRRTNHRNLHVRGYKERGSINTPMELAIENNIDRFSLAIEAINRVPALSVTGLHVKQQLLDQQIDCRRHAHTVGMDRPDIRSWVWPS